jgi:hypothetical protein
MKIPINDQRSIPRRILRVFLKKQPACYFSITWNAGTLIVSGNIGRGTLDS